MYEDKIFFFTFLGAISLIVNTNVTKPTVSRAVTKEYDRTRALITDNGYGICGFLANGI